MIAKILEVTGYWLLIAKVIMYMQDKQEPQEIPQEETKLWEEGLPNILYFFHHSMMKHE